MLVSPSRRTADLAELRRRIAVLEAGAARAVGGALAFGVPAIDRALPGGGLALGAVHEITGSAAFGLAALLAGRASAERGRAVLWCVAERAAEELYAPGLAAFGLGPGRLVLLRCRGAREMLWALEEGLRDPAPAAVVAELPAAVGLAASRRLQLAAETGGTLGLIVREEAGERSESGRLAPSAVATRWRVDAVPADGSDRGGARWRIALLRCRGTRLLSQPWTVDWHDATGDLALVSASCDRPAAAPRCRTVG